MSSGSKNILIILLLALVFVMGYMMLNTKNEGEEVTEIPAIQEKSEVTSKKVEWETLSESELADIFFFEPDIFYEKESGLKLSETLDLTGDGVTEGIFIGHGGNNNVSFILTTEADGTIVTAKEKDKDGNTAPVSLYEIGRVMVYQNFKLLPAEHGYYKVTMDFDETAKSTETSHFKCNEDSVNAYAWDEQTKLFAWNQELTTKYTKEVCK